MRSNVDTAPVTSQYKIYIYALGAGFGGISDRLVIDFMQPTVIMLLP